MKDGWFYGKNTKPFMRKETTYNIALGTFPSNQSIHNTTKTYYDVKQRVELFPALHPHHTHRHRKRENQQLSWH